MTDPSKPNAVTAKPAPRIDAHHHCWDRSQPFDYTWQETDLLAPICRNSLPTDLKPHLDRLGIEQSVLVQTQHRLAENDWALALADEYPFIAGVVGWVDLASPQCEEMLISLIQRPKFVGVRHVTQDEPDDFIIRPDILRGLRTLEKHGVPFDLLFYAKHLRHAPTVARACPDLKLVIDHLSKPLVKTGQLDPWRGELEAAATFPNIFCKLSGLITEADWDHWKPADLRPYLQIAIDAFGPERCLFGSDWPVCTLAGSYEDVYHALDEVVADLSSTEQAAIYGGTASRFYGLPSSP